MCLMILVLVVVIGDLFCGWVCSGWWVLCEMCVRMVSNM